MEKQSFEELRLKFLAKITPYKQKVEEEFIKRKNGYLDPTPVEGLDETLLVVANRMIELQIQKGYFSRQDMLPGDFSKIQTLAQKYGISNKEAVALLIENDRYMSPEAIEVENICNLIEDIILVYETHYENLQAFPINALTAQSRNYLSNKKIPLSLSNKFKIFIDEYLPELSGMKLIEKSYRAVPRYRFQYNDEIARQMATEIKSLYADKNGNIDALFLEKNQGDLKKLLAVLGERNISFDDFVSKNNLNYTRCYIVSSEQAVLHMIENYFLGHGTYQGITANDPYLRQKIDTLQEQLKIFSLSELLKSFNIENDVLDNGQTLSNTELVYKQSDYFAKLERVYPSKIISEGFIKNNRRLYDEGLKLATRLGYKSYNEFLAHGGFIRHNNNTHMAQQHTIILTERDLKNYSFYIDGDIQSIQNCITNFDMKILNIENALATYQKLVANGFDSSRSKGLKNKQFGEN